MPSLIVPRSGLPLDFGSKPGAAEGMIALTLSDDVIENMIKCIGDSQEIQLSYGAESTISYGANTLRFTTSQDNFTYDIYQNTVTSSNSPNTPEISKGPRKNNNCKLAYMGTAAGFLTPKGKPKRPDGIAMARAQKAQQNSAKAQEETAGADAALEALKSNVAAEKARKAANTTQKASNQLPIPGAQRSQAARDRTALKNATGGAAAAAKRAMGRNIGSIPSSPALNASSPALAPTSVPASETAAEKTKAIRAPIIHILAIAPATEADLLKYKKSSTTTPEFKSALDKVADLVDGKYMLRNKLYKELDVWTFEYNSQKDRQTAIDNAVKAFDKMRMSGSEPEWQLLYPVDERGKGNTLSKLQAKIALNGPAGPSKPKPAADSYSTHDSDEEEDGLFGTPAGKKPMNAAKTKAQKEREAQDKRLSGKATAKQKTAAARSAPAKREAEPKATGKGKKAAAPSSNFKSSEFVNDSDEEEEEEAYVPQLKKRAAPANNKRKSDEELSGSPPKKAKPAATSSSSSSQSGKSTSQPTGRSTQSSQLAQKSSTVASVQRSINQARSKVITSPKKSSPLASSPPISASDEDDKSTSVSPAAPTKRKLTNAADREDRDAKRRKDYNGATQAVSKALQEDTDKFTLLYEKYVSLYQELEGKGEREREGKEMERLGRLEGRLVELKGRILEGAKG